MDHQHPMTLGAGAAADIQSLSSYRLITKLMDRERQRDEQLDRLIIAELSGRGVFLPTDSPQNEVARPRMRR